MLRNPLFMLVGVLLLAAVVLANSHSVAVSVAEPVYRNQNAQLICAPAGFQPMTYNWDFGDGTNAQTIFQLITHKYKALGQYTAKCTAVDNNGKTASGSVDFDVINSPPKSFIEQPDFAKENKGKMTVDFHTQLRDVDGKIDYYSINFGDGQVSDFRPKKKVVDERIKHAYPKSGVYTVWVESKDNDGAETSDYAYAVVPNSHKKEKGEWVDLWMIQPNTTLSLVPQQFYVYAFFSKSDFDPLGIDCAWAFGDGTQANGCNLRVVEAHDGQNNNHLDQLVMLQTTHAYGTPGIHNAQLDLTWNRIEHNGRVRQRAKSAAAVNVVTDNRIPHASFTNSSTCFMYRNCTFNASASKDDDGTIASYDWDFGNGGTGSGKVVDFAFTNFSGLVTVKLTVTDDSGASNSTKNVVEVFVPEERVDQGTDLNAGMIVTAGPGHDPKLIAQSFVPSVNRVERVKLKMGGSSWGNTTVSLRSAIGGQDLASATLDADTINSYLNNNEYVPIPIHQDVTPGSTYYIVAKPAGDNQNFYFHNGDPYPAGDGYRWLQTANDWIAFSRDTSFQTTYFT
ncbi:PKD domain-containing protein [Candidatus Micrarchaeota archaeon]|nr:PKD domain-containing protein [Candidatus Micrarchaeota archaeon]